MAATVNSLRFEAEIGPIARPQGITKTSILCPSHTSKPPMVELDAIYESLPIKPFVDRLVHLQMRLEPTYDRARTLLFFYVAIKYGIKSLRHLRARGTIETFRDGWSWLSEVCSPRSCILLSRRS